MVAVVDTAIQTIVETFQHRMAGIILIVIELGNTWVTPSTDGLIGRQLVGIPKLAHKTGCTTIQAVDIAITVCTGITC